ncbi:hypothetical protein KEM48_002213 [Puccinia striiformis f. sp. tritici PST-130]|nr:hypothetical protein KEM48_002213 [Puccinia striiformis f. sp. tritici PST-130]
MFHPVLPSLVVVCILGLLNVVRADDLDYAYRYYPSGNELRVDGTKDSYDCPANCQSFYHATGCTIDDGSSKEKTTQVCSNRYAPSGASGKACTNAALKRYICTGVEGSSTDRLVACRVQVLRLQDRPPLVQWHSLFSWNHVELFSKDSITSTPGRLHFSTPSLLCRTFCQVVEYEKWYHEEMN